MISIIVPVYNNLEMTKECLKAIGKNTLPEYEVIIIDNGSLPSITGTTGGGFYKPTSFSLPWNLLIRNEENKGFPVAVNQGIVAAKGDTIVLLNNDVIVTPYAINRLVAMLDNGYDIVGSMTNYCAGVQQITIPSYNNQTELDRQADLFFVKNAGKSIEVNWVIGFFMAFKKSLYDAVGPFDESLWPCSGEELDFCLHARSMKKKIGIAQDVYVHHFGSQTFTEMQKNGQLNYQEICRRNDTHIQNKWGDFWNKQLV
jgi:GT2 family glycosyltransferase